MRLWCLAVTLVTACGPTLEATNARHVMIEVEANELVDKCEIACQRILRPGERVTRCSTQESGWHLNPTFEGERNPPVDTKTFDMATILGPEVAGFAVCTIGGGS